MMPKVMPVMLKRVAERAPMPQYMAEQMPDMMLKVIDNLMPHMIGDVVPLVVTDPRSRWIRLSHVRFNKKQLNVEQIFPIGNIFNID
jgi:hypothetical protein